jgi:hypothetical protein
VDEACKRLARGVLLRRLLRSPGADPELLAVDHGRAGEAPVVRRPFDVDDGVGDGERPPSELLLELGLVVDVARDRVLDPVSKGGDDRGADRLESVLEVEGPEGGLDERGDDVPVLRELPELLGRDAARVLGELRAEVEAAPDDRTALARDDVGPDLREPTLLVFGEALVQLLRDRETQDAVAEELEPLVRTRPILGPRGVREDPLRRRRRKRVDQGAQVQDATGAAG